MEGAKFAHIKEFFTHKDSVDIFIGFRCNAQCPHCGTMSSPFVDWKVESESISKFVRSAAALGYRRIYITGGEPLLHREAFDLCVSLAKELNMQVDVITNGFWAADRIAAEGIIKRIVETGGVIYFSMDDFHSPYIKPATVAKGVNLMLAKAGFAYVTAVLNGENHAIKELMRIMVRDNGPCTIEEELSEGDLENHVLTFGGGTVTIHYKGISPIGRAEGMETNFKLKSIDEFPEECPDRSAMSLVPGGDIRPCPAPGQDFLSLGNINDSGLPDILENSEIMNNYKCGFSYSKHLWKTIFHNEDKKFFLQCNVCYEISKRLGGWQKLIREMERPLSEKGEKTY